MRQMVSNTVKRLQSHILILCLDIKYVPPMAVNNAMTVVIIKIIISR